MGSLNLWNGYAVFPPLGGHHPVLCSLQYFSDSVGLDSTCGSVSSCIKSLFITKTASTFIVSLCHAFWDDDTVSCVLVINNMKASGGGGYTEIMRPPKVGSLKPETVISCLYSQMVSKEIDIHPNISVWLSVYLYYGSQT